ncbi:MBL fold metallo-hydrolase [Salipaludibacillus agaradhaerens]|uniref:MBL fold metallo-hydrolase n=1 Tax=Salipaludibacillus agaradhaerens TaxID=76935 RepID=A0A9Q4AZ54_SALAG|nr:MBL fold metallo-hydrolase [Salipaludibacillus agaradhaerens]MCR6095473.1 MBL fold metallo-hydrolase [Salipaludibacillus agaradhaerens]MCR6114967.1 MBL fold metallo-hydrolase [Salipaludibacillus agaradhaerens]
METWHVSDHMRLTWLNGGVTHMDGGAMFGVVPKPLWGKKYPVNEKNQIELRTDPILIQTGGKNLLVDTGIGNEKLSEKEKRNFGVTQESKIDESLKMLNLSRQDIDHVLMTHMHFDHACGLTIMDNNSLVSAFPNATIHVHKTEWEEMCAPNIRSRNTYFSTNREGIEEQIATFENDVEVVTGVRLIHTGGHSAGHAILKLSTEDKTIWHLADIMPTHAHLNVLWVLAYDDYPMDSIEAKQAYIPKATQNGEWFIFYHDYRYRAIKWDSNGQQIIDALERNMKNE